MRKQTKMVAVASAAALLAIGASMTSFAATGWVEEDGQWYFYNKDGDRVEDEWKKSGDNWYWLDSEENGAMAVDKLIDDDDDTYYVDANGVMVKNTWVKVVNEDQDDDDDPAEYNYYYMQSNGKAYKAPDSGETKFRTIDGKRYAFDDDGKMLYGWVDGDSSRLSGDTDWESRGEKDVYYCGDWEDGAMKTGWQKITVCDGDDDDEEKDFWFWFKSNGKRYINTSGKAYKEDKKINGKKYGFDDRGVMVYEWANMDTATGGDASVSNWRYFSDPEDGARKTKGWFKVVAPSDNNDNVFDPNYDGTGFASTDADDEAERWYYADSDGILKEGCIDKIKGKYYGFWPEDGVGDQKAGSMLSGLVLLEVKDDRIMHVWDDGIDSDELDDLIDDGEYKGDPVVPSYGGDVVTLFYFGNSSDADFDGSMKTGTTSLSIDGDSYQFKFEKSGGAEGKGRGVTGIDDDKYIYRFGAKVKADSDDKYRVVYADGDISDDATVFTLDSEDIRKNAVKMGVNKDSETVKIVGEVGKAWPKNYKLVNTSGAIVDTKNGAKDGDDWYFYVDDEQIVMYSNNNTLKGKADEDKAFMDLNLDRWKDWTDTDKIYTDDVVVEVSADEDDE